MENIRWGIVGPGRIAEKAAEAIRALGAEDGGMELYAVASRDMGRAQEFAGRHGAKKAFGSYEGLFSSHDVDAVYIATPHTFHADLSLSAIEGGKHVVVEKPAAVNEGQLLRVTKAAREKGLFLMEATWMCFNPAVRTALSWVEQGLIGSLGHIEASFSFRNKPDPADRLFSPALAGGALLDTGIYPVTFAMMAAGGGSAARPCGIASSAKISGGIDEWNSVLLNFPSGVTARLESAVTTESASNARDAYVYGTDGYIKIPLFWMAEEAQLYAYGADGPTLVRTERLPFRINGYEYEFAEAARCIRQGKTESPLHTQEDALSVCRVLDECRRQWGLTYPFEAAGKTQEAASESEQKKGPAEKDESVVIYTDGGCHGNPGPGGWGAVILHGGTELSLSGGEESTTNNRMELTAAIRALRHVAEEPSLCTKKVSLYSDSQYVKNGITSWIRSWKKNGWLTSAKKPVLNRDLWQELDRLNQELDVRWSWVKGHAGITYNEKCDSLCQMEIAKLGH